ncbi:hypothetical protein G6F58_013124 [Rhizopus delemar]|nr:hypothetical protein G6F58_013124 [Rhizopus delemar]
MAACGCVRAWRQAAGWWSKVACCCSSWSTVRRRRPAAARGTPPHDRSPDCLLPAPAADGDAGAAVVHRRGYRRVPRAAGGSLP